MKKPALRSAATVIPHVCLAEAACPRHGRGAGFGAVALADQNDERTDGRFMDAVGMHGLGARCGCAACGRGAEPPAPTEETLRRAEVIVLKAMRTAAQALQPGGRGRDQTPAFGAQADSRSRGVSRLPCGVLGKLEDEFSANNVSELPDNRFGEARGRFAVPGRLKASPQGFWGSLRTNSPLITSQSFPTTALGKL